MKNLALTTLTLVTLTIFAGDARAQGTFFGNLFGLNNWRPATTSRYYTAAYPAANCSNGTCTTTQYAPGWNTTDSYGNSTGSGYSNLSPSGYRAGSGAVNWNTPQPVVPASYNNCPGGYCPQTPATLYNSTPYTPGSSHIPVSHTPTYNTPAYNTPVYNYAPYTSY